MLLGRKLISPGDDRRFTIDYVDFLDTTETLSGVVFAVSTGPATVPNQSIAADGKSVSFFTTGAQLTTATFNVTVVATTTLGQIKNDHIEFNVVAS